MPLWPYANDWKQQETVEYSQSVLTCIMFQTTTDKIRKFKNNQSEYEQTSSTEKNELKCQ